MDFNCYQDHAATTVIYPTDGLTGLAYTALGLAGEAGEVANKVKKVIRDDGEITPEKTAQIVDEVGDVLWYCANLLRELDCPMGLAASKNLEKLFARKKRGALRGSGDEDDRN